MVDTEEGLLDVVSFANRRSILCRCLRGICGGEVGGIDGDDSDGDEGGGLIVSHSSTRVLSATCTTAEFMIWRGRWSVLKRRMSAVSVPAFMEALLHHDTLRRERHALSEECGM
jgi:hypothetical protein